MTDSAISKPCQVSDCETPAAVKRLCNKHYLRLYRHGDAQYTSRLTGEGDSDVSRFWSRVVLTANPLKCWVWLGCASPYGYGKVRWNNKTEQAHRVAFEIVKGFRPTQHLLHSCDNPLCVNPNHLREGTPQENVADMVKKARNAVGEKIGSAKLKDAQVIAIRELVSNGASMKSVADTYGVHPVTVGKIVKKETWRHLLRVNSDKSRKDIVLK